MNISLNWLREFVDWTGTPEELATLLTRTGLEVGSIATRGADFPKVVIAQILEATQHPNADRLSVCRVDDGSGHPRQIVCGAKNFKVGDKVPLALPGAVLPGDFKIKVGKLRGVESEGMLCSAKELSLAADADGLLILPADAPVGQPIATLFPPETAFEIEITPNRPDWLSHVGIAREVAAFTSQPLKWTRPAAPQTAEYAGRIGDLERCPFYTLQRITDVKVGPSPDWLRQRLESVGLRSINNIVDVTNFVMLEIGQPLHAFDAAKVNGDIQVRLAGEGEKFLALDGREYTLSADDLVIADSSRALALAGVMGGEESGVTETTTEILLESAVFQTSGVRRTGRRLDLHSDSSYRFERGIDPAGVLAASARATQLILELAGGTITGSVEVSGKEPQAPAPVALRQGKVNALLGLELTDDEISSALSGLGLSSQGVSETSTTWEIPSHRLDLTREVDLVEEVARVVGIDRIPSRVSANPAEPTKADASYDFQIRVRGRLAGLGLSEARTSTLVSPASVWSEAEAIKLKNPLGEDQSFLRSSLIPGLLAAVERNLRYGAASVALFEIGRTFHARGREESPTLAIALTGQSRSSSWRDGTAKAFDWWNLKGIIAALVPVELEWKKADAQGDLALVSTVSANGKALGLIGQLSPAAARKLDARESVLVAEIDLSVLQSIPASPVYREIPKYPATTRDIAIVVPSTLPYGEIEKTLLAVREPLLMDIEPFDVFSDETGVKLAADRKSVAISLTFRAPERTLNSDEVTASVGRLRDKLKADLGAEFRE